MLNKPQTDTILLSVGPHQLITQYILSKQLNFNKENIGVLRTHTITDGGKVNNDLEKSEVFVYEILKLKLVAHIASIYNLWGTSTLSKLVNLLFLKRKIKKYLINQSLDVNVVTSVIMTARYDLGEILILSAFKNLKDVYFISDGSPLVYQRTFNLPFYLKLMGFKNPYDNNPKVFFYKKNTPVNYKNIELDFLKESYVNEIHNLFDKDEKLNSWLNKLFLNKRKKLSIILMHPLSTPNIELNTNFYIDVVKLELEKSDNYIVFKQHPREPEENLNVFKSKILSLFGNKVAFYDNNYLSRIPIELYSNNDMFDRFITMYSTGVLFADKDKVYLYASKAFPEIYINYTKSLSSDYQLEFSFV